ncbi:2-oxoglutarate dehydrogenase complex component E1 [Tribolium castaneum]|uniref:2-oxoglutarate dehydrogenase, mitochondrial n=1 Tax=Tribolium castaneum TaxID=7070 RepID=D6WZ76_TRICA|nr:PREDICTED: 2-oxoglutarate dehydrogenase, mitochondrial [Tribolium castaneum]EFA10391.1 putative 2-oxoglutarate dehydrogenase E1 component DHKTD1 homolog, mitochondrial-like Protein [Tribolium castaneum]|eukprot:XP_974704.1 PREDICTED: 2-oxoglutarate dehydrogenase, mitochondrial [Tribolium castaneum]
MSSLKLLSFLKLAPQCLRHYSETSFLTGTSSQYIEDMYNAWLKDPSSVHVSWDSFFRNTSQGLPQPYHAPPNLAPSKGALVSQIAAVATPPQTAPLDERTIEDHLAVQAVIRSYQARGHLVAKLDPLEIMFNDKTTTTVSQTGSPPEEILRTFRLENLDKVYKLPSSTYIGAEGEKKLPLREILHRLELAYCRHIGVEYMYIDDLEQRDFIRRRMEAPGVLNQSTVQKKLTLTRLIRTVEFENFLAKKWASEKRFGIEGCDMFIPGLEQIIDKSTEHGVEHFFLGLSHRGRLNTLANILRKPLYQIFNQFVPLEPADLGSGDVKYHHGSHTQRTNQLTQKHYKVTLLANPSHLESVNSVVLGRTRAEQFYKGDDEGKKSLAILIHGDAAFSGQGVNYESYGLSYLPHYTTHGAICFIINNQVGFTTDPRFSRSSRYCSDLGKVVNAPIFHVNADDPESVIHVCNIAAEWRAKFHKDIIIDLVGYRRHGHNEADEPMFTQPLMYTKIKSMASIGDKYSSELLKEKVVTKDEIKHVKDDYNKLCEDEYVKASKQTQIFIRDWLDSPWSGFFEGKDPLKVTPTGVPEATLAHIGAKVSSPPPPNLDFVLHKGITRILNQREAMVKNRQIDWALGEAMAIGSLVKEGVHVRLSGEDVERGTFSHRHHVYHHQTVDKMTYQPLGDVFDAQAPYVVCNSSLSEYGVLGFEVGYALANPNSLILWEAQFGDFYNTAQCIMDQFLCCGQAKWMRQIGLVVLLPHGFDGMGPEHSSGRPERFLQNCDDDPDVVPPPGPDFAIKQLHDCNWIVANCSTPANLFHIWRRQVALPFRKPLILFSPKNLLRHPECKSSFDEMLEGTEFKRVIPDSGPASQDPQNVKKLILCTGKVYYDIMDAFKKKKVGKEIAVTRVEQLSPFPYDLLKTEFEKYPNAKICWAQEEHKNGGPYLYVLARLNTLLNRSREIHYIGRAVSAAPATGTKAVHLKEVEMLANEFVAL